VSILPACTKLAALEQGIEIHKQIVRYGFQSVVAVMNSLIDMYAKCARIEKARKLFDEMHLQDVVSWTVMIAGYAKNGMGEEAMKLFLQMQSAGVKPNSMTFINVLAACADLAALEQGK
jgi:pentatricopeptide repeat protein